MTAPLPDEWALFLKTRTKEARTAVAELYLKLPGKVVQQSFPGVKRSNSFVNRDELEQEGFAGLIRGIEMFDPSRGVPPEAFLRQKIWSAIMDTGLRKADGVGRNGRALIKAAERIEARIVAEGRVPHTDDIAAELGVDADELVKWRKADKCFNATILSAFDKGGDEDAFESPDLKRAGPQGLSEHREAVERAMLALFHNKKPQEVKALLLFHAEKFSIRETYRVLMRKKSHPSGAASWLIRIREKSESLLG